MKKKNRFIRWLPFIFTTLLLLGSSMTVFATTVYHIPSDLDVDNYNYLICKDNNDTYYCYAIEKKYGFYGFSNTDGNYYCTDSKFITKWSTNDMTNWGNGSYSGISSSINKNIFVSSSDGQYAVVSNIDVKETDSQGNENGKIFFQRPPVPISELAIPLTATVQTQTKIIIPIAVCCLALLIGSIVLLPRLRLFLLR